MIFKCAYLILGCALSSLKEYEAFSHCAPQQVHLSLTDNVDSMYVTWASNYRCEGKGIVKYWESDNSPATNASQNVVKVDQYLHVDEGNTTRTRMGYTFRTKMTYLKPNMTYNYVVGIFKKPQKVVWSKKFKFKTFPTDVNWTPTILLLADMGTDNAQAWPFIVEDALKSVDVIIHIGDFAYDLDRYIGHNGDRFMNMIEPVASQIPYMPVPGNHEGHVNFSEYFNRFTTSGPRSLFYSIDVGPFHFVMLNSAFYFKVKYGFDQILTQYNWLRKDLEKANKSRKQQKWVITFAHRAMYTTSKDKIKGPQPERIRVGFDHFPGFEKLFYENNVDTCFWGHEHNYERFYPIYNYIYNISENKNVYENFEGIPHFIVGNAGAREPLTPFDKIHPPWSAVRKSSYGYAKLTNLNSTTLYLRAYGIHKLNYTRFLMDHVTIKY